MKKRLVIYTTIAIIIIFLMIFFNKRNSLNRRFNITIPKSAEIIEFQRSFKFIDGREIAAKITIPQNDYNGFLNNISKKYKQYELKDCDVDHLGEISIPNTDGPISFSACHLTWWDLEVERISKIYYEEQWFGSIRRCPYNKEIYVVENSELVTIYLYCDFLL